jgi:RsmE family RNA methyltransferase
MNIVLCESLSETNRLSQSDDRFEHIVKVLRLTIGDHFLAGEINGHSGLATITQMDRTGLVFSWVPEKDAASLVPVTLVVAQVRPICMKRILREAASFGVSKIIVTGTDTGEKSYRDAKLWSTGEYLSYLVDGAMQSGCTGIGSCLFSGSVDALMDMQALGCGDRLVLDNAASVTDSLSSYAYQGGEVVVAIGPERGWSMRERLIFAQGGFVSKTLGKRILRTETACAATVAVLLSRMGIV